MKRPKKSRPLHDRDDFEYWVRNPDAYLRNEQRIDEYADKTEHNKLSKFAKKTEFSVSNVHGQIVHIPNSNGVVEIGKSLPKSFEHLVPALEYDPLRPLTGPLVERRTTFDLESGQTESDETRIDALHPLAELIYSTNVMSFMDEYNLFLLTEYILGKWWERRGFIPYALDRLRSVGFPISGKSMDAVERRLKTNENTTGIVEGQAIDEYNALYMMHPWERIHYLSIGASDYKVETLGEARLIYRRKRRMVEAVLSEKARRARMREDGLYGYKDARDFDLVAIGYTFVALLSAQFTTLAGTVSTIGWNESAIKDLLNQSGASWGHKHATVPLTKAWLWMLGLMGPKFEYLSLPDGTPFLRPRSKVDCFGLKIANDYTEEPLGRQITFHLSAARAGDDATET